MKIIIDDNLNEELRTYLLTQDGIEKVDITIREFMSEINIEFNGKTSPEIIINFIYLFQNNKFPIMFEFDKGIKEKCKTLKYVVNDMCCEYCYKSLIQDLFDNEFVISVKSNFDFNKPAFNIEFFIGYSNDYDENKLLQYIKEKIKP